MAAIVRHRSRGFRLTRAIIAEVYRLSDAGATQLMVARKLGIPRNVVNKVLAARLPEPHPPLLGSRGESVAGDGEVDRETRNRAVRLYVREWREGKRDAKAG